MLCNCVGNQAERIRELSLETTMFAASRASGCQRSYSQPPLDDANACSVRRNAVRGEGRSISCKVQRETSPTTWFPKCHCCQIFCTLGNVSKTQASCCF